MKGLEHLSYKERLRGLELLELLFHPGEEEASGEPTGKRERDH